MPESAPEFLNGGGEMGSRMRSFDWSGTPLGAPHTWPQSLRTIVRVMLDSRFAMWMAWGPDGTFFCNDAYLPTVGLKSDWVLGARADAVWREIWHDIGPRIEHVLTAGEATWDEGLQLFLERSGYPEETFHTFSYSPVYGDDNCVAGMLCVVVEDTKRAIGERRLRFLRELAALPTRDAPTLGAVGELLAGSLEQDAEDVPFAAIYLSEEGTGGHARLAGQTRNVGAGVLPARSDAETPASRSLDAALRLGAAHSLGDVEQSLGFIRGAWSEPVQEAMVLPLTVSGKSEPLGALIAGVSTRRRLDDDYQAFFMLVASQVASRVAETQSRLDERRKAEALAEIDRAKNVFFSNVSHEFRTPLTLMLGPVDQALDTAWLPNELRDALKLVQRNGQRLRKLVNSLLDFSRIEAGRIEGLFQPTDLGSLTRDLASAFRSAVENAGMRFEVDCPSLGEPVFVDTDMWEKVVLNLLSNAFKFTFEGTVAISLRIESRDAVLIVSDSGTGMDGDALEHVFDRFHRVAGARSRSHEGTGIGLALVKELVKLHGGNVTAASEPTKGSRFTVTVPLGTAHLPPSRVAAEPARASNANLAKTFVDDSLRGADSAALPSRPLQHVGANTATILFVDDNADMRSYVSAILRANPRWSVETAADGLQALRSIERRPPDVVITDLMMPVLDGFGLIERIRSQDKTRTLPVIVLSAQAGEEAQLEGLGKGADDYLVKPFSARELVARVEVLLIRENMHAVRDALHRRLQDVFDNAPVAVALLDGPNHVFSYTNEEYARLIGHRPALGKTLLEAMPELGGQGIVEILDDALRTGEPFAAKGYALNLNDPASGVAGVRYFDVVCQPLAEPASSSPSTIAVVCFEVTEQLEARRSAEDANRAKDEFLAVLGHELRNPLAPIRTALHLMELQSPETAVREREIIKRQVGHMVRLVDDLLDVARITRGGIDLQRRVVDLGEIARQAVETASPMLEQKRQHLELDLAGDLFIHGDAVRVAQIIANLLTNASKFTEEGRRVRVDAVREGDDAVVAVTDDGIGMTADEIAVVFEPFVQSTRQDLHRPDGGLGLGLAIARSLAALHGGTLTARSEGLLRGSRFELRLPVHEKTTASTPAAHEKTVPPARAAGAGRRVLVVDDNEDAAETLALLLESLGHEPFVAKDGPTALDFLNETAVEVAILDIGLPVMNGYELAQRIRSRSGAQRVRLIAVTGYGQPDDRVKSAAHGFDQHLVKPVDVAELLRVIA